MHVLNWKRNTDIFHLTKRFRIYGKGGGILPRNTIQLVIRSLVFIWTGDHNKKSKDDFKHLQLGVLFLLRQTSLRADMNTATWKGKSLWRLPHFEP